MGEQEKERLERITKTLERLNIVLKDQNGNWKNMTYVLNKLAEAWHHKLVSIEDIKVIIGEDPAPWESKRSLKE